MAADCTQPPAKNARATATARVQRLLNFARSHAPLHPATRCFRLSPVQAVLMANQQAYVGASAMGHHLVYSRPASVGW